MTGPLHYVKVTFILQGGPKSKPLSLVIIKSY